MVWHWDFLARLAAAGVMGGVIGLNREYYSKGAGVRTHFLVSLGSALIMIVSQHGFNGVGDPARLAAQVVSGIGFLCAGTIILNKQFIRGLTTAAGLWTAAGIGLTCGAGMYFIAIAATVLTLIGLELLKYVVDFYGAGRRIMNIDFTIDSVDSLDKVLAEFSKNKYHIETYSVTRVSSEAASVSMMVRSLDRKRPTDHLVLFIQKMPGVILEKFE